MSPTTRLQWGAEGLWQSLVPLLPGISVEVLAKVESSNTRLLERARAFSGDRDGPVTRPGDLDAQPGSQRTPHGRRSGDIQPCLLVAEDQTRGRGRLGRDWISQPGRSLTFSLSLPLAPAQWGGLSLAVGLALAEALDPRPLGEPLLASGQPLSRIALKWPNDLWLLDTTARAATADAGGGAAPLRGRKLGGILIETVSVGQQRMCVVGVGLNIAAAPAAAMEGLAHGYASLNELVPSITAPQALARVVVPLVQALQSFERRGFAPLVAAYQRRDLLRGQAVHTSAPEPLQGLAQGVDEQGALLVQVGQGEHTTTRRVLSGEVSVRLSGA